MKKKSLLEEIGQVLEYENEYPGQILSVETIKHKTKGLKTHKLLILNQKDNSVKRVAIEVPMNSIEVFKVNIDPKVLKQAYSLLHTQACIEYDNKFDEIYKVLNHLLTIPEKGDTVKVHKGKSVPIGTIGEVVNVSPDKYSELSVLPNIESVILAQLFESYKKNLLPLPKNSYRVLIIDSDKNKHWTSSNNIYNVNHNYVDENEMLTKYKELYAPYAYAKQFVFNID